jgi:hypothetical protein
VSLSSSVTPAFSKLVLVGSSPYPVNDVVLGLQEAAQTLEDPIDPAFVRDFQVSTTFPARSPRRSSTAWWPRA